MTRNSEPRRRLGAPPRGRSLPGALWLLLLAAAGIALALVLASALAMMLALDSAPRVPESQRPQWQDVARAKRLIDQHRPGESPPGQMRAAALTPRDLTLLFEQAARHFTAQAPRLQVDLAPGRARLQASLASPLPVLRGWFNLDALLRQTDALPSIERASIGSLPLPPWLIENLLPRLLPLVRLGQPTQLAQRVVNHVEFTPQALVVAFTWPRDTGQLLADSLLARSEQDRLLPYAHMLRELAAQRGPQRSMPLGEALTPLFKLAAERSAAGESAERENRAALLALTLLNVHPSALARIAPATRPYTEAPPLRLTLHGRDDTPKHFLVSAVLAAESGSPLADAVGVYKEVSDSRGGTGFSFNDLAADRAGTRVGQHLRNDARRWQRLLAAGVGEAELLPPVADLPENLPDAEFQQRFGGVNGPAYRRLMAEIEARLDRLPLLAER